MTRYAYHSLRKVQIHDETVNMKFIRESLMIVFSENEEIVMYSSTTTQEGSGYPSEYPLLTDSAAVFTAGSLLVHFICAVVNLPVKVLNLPTGRTMRLRCPLLLTSASLTPLAAMTGGPCGLGRRPATRTWTIALACSTAADSSEGDNVHLPWTLEDDRRLYEAYSRNQSLEELCALMKRGRVGVQARLR